jgi:hypothetical protein
MVARLRGDKAATREAFTRARAELEVKLRASLDYAKALVMPLSREVLRGERLRAGA